MQVSHFNTFLDGGAAIAAQRLHEELLGAGVDSCFYHSRREGHREDLGPTYQPTEWRSSGLRQRISSALRFRLHRATFKRAIRDQPVGHDIFTSPRGIAASSGPPVGKHQEGPRPRRHDIVHLHWVAKLIDYHSFFDSLPIEQPIVWTLHDMNPITGGCHFSSGCGRFQLGCGNCPQLSSGTADDLSQRFFDEKRAALRDLNLHVVAPSHWLLAAAESSPILATARSFTHIPYGISTSDYYPMDRAEARARLGIHPDTTVFCIGPVDTSTRRGGAHHLVGALEAITDLEQVEVLVFGGELPTRNSVALPQLRAVGPPQGLLHQRTVYSASDVVVLPTLEDNLPLAAMEAMACGTTVVAFDVGGIPEIVRNNRTGLLTRPGDTTDLGRALRKLATWPDLSRVLGENARQMIESEFSPQQEAASYQQLYAALLASTSGLRLRAA